MKNFIKKTGLRKLALCFITIGLLICFTPRVTAQTADSKGKDFWLMFDGSDIETSAPTLTLFITSSVNTSGTVEIPGLGFSVPFVVTANTVTPIEVPTDAEVHTSDVKDTKGIHVTALDDVTVYGLNYELYITDAYLGLPTDVLGTSYIVLTYSNSNIVNGSEFGIVGSANSTTVTITPSVASSGHAAGVPYDIVLNQGETYELVNTDGTGDLSGTIITSTKPVGVFGAHRCANIPGGYGYCDHLCEMLPPTSTWGKKFATVPLKSRTNGDTWRFLASENATTVTVNGVAQTAINKGQFIETLLTTQSIIESDKPILVAQYSNGSTYSGEPGDPFMMLIPPLEQFLPGYTVTTVSGFVSHYINLIAPNAIVGLLKLDGVAVPAAEFTPIGTTGFSGAQVTVEEGSHTLIGTLPFGAFQYGFNSDDSYGYPGGQSFSPVATVNSVTLTPETGSGTINTQACFSAAVKDQFNAAVVGVRVDFNIIGPNSSRSGFAITNSSGVAAFCYNGTTPGLDSLIADVGTIGDTSRFTWTNNSCNITLSYKATNVSCKGGTNGAIDLTVSGGTAPFTYAWSNGATTEDLTDLNAGSFSATVTDANKCTQSATVVISEPAAALQASSVAGTIACNGSTTTVTVTATGGTEPYTGTGTFSTGAGDYSYTVKDANGCTSVTTGTITQPASPVSCSIAVSPNPTIPGGALNTIYVGNGPQTVTLTGTGAGGAGEYSYDWGTAGSGNSILVSPTETTTYTLTVTDANQCTSTCTVTINVVPAGNACEDNPVTCAIKVFPNPPVPGEALNTIYKGYGLQSLLLDGVVHGGVGPYTYTWSGGSRFLYDPLRIVCPDKTTNYSLEVKDSRGCTSTCTVTIKVVDARCGWKDEKILLCYKNHEICVSKFEVLHYLFCGAKLGSCKDCDRTLAVTSKDISISNQSFSAIKVYPNPANKYLNVEWNPGYDQQSILKIIDLQGRVLLSKQFSGLLKGSINTTRLDLNGFAKGLYLLQAKGKNGTQTIKFTVE